MSATPDGHPGPDFEAPVAVEPPAPPKAWEPPSGKEAPVAAAHTGGGGRRRPALLVGAGVLAVALIAAIVWPRGGGKTPAGGSSASGSSVVMPSGSTSPGATPTTTPTYPNPSGLPRPAASASTTQMPNSPAVPIHTFHPSANAAGYLLPGYRKGAVLLGAGEPLGLSGDGTVLAYRDASGVVAVDLRSRKTVWQADSSLCIQATVPLHGRLLCQDPATIIGNKTSNSLFWLDIATGHITPYARLPGDAVSVRLVETNVLAGTVVQFDQQKSQTQHVAAFDWRGRQLWSATVPGATQCVPASAHVVCRQVGNRLTALARATGKVTMRDVAVTDPVRLASDGFVFDLPAGGGVALDYNGRAIAATSAYAWNLVPGAFYDSVTYPLTDYYAVGQTFASALVDAAGRERAVVVADNAYPHTMVLFPAARPISTAGQPLFGLVSVSADGSVVLTKGASGRLYDSASGRLVAELPESHDVSVVQGVIQATDEKGVSRILVPRR